MTKVNFKNSLIAVAIGLVMVSCGGGNSNKQSATTETSEQQAAPAVEVKSTDKSTVADYLAHFGLTEDDIKPTGFVSFEGPDGWLIKVNASENQFDIWAKKVFDKIKTISTDGKVYDQGYPTFKEEASFVNGGTLYQWAYPYNSKTVEVDITRGDTPTLYRITLHF